ncbi:hypothetical protein K440DRAFT_578392 [Wilcoxina mikolae CBS 423.85]|nr:hypothetical protein K440DRAFT_578392 [Wilcoxina mikolae CBS 423.85]
MIAIILLFQQLSISYAAPLSSWQPSLDNLTALQHHTAPSWVPEPRYRGTWSILWSCTATLILCIYNALHLNVPTKDNRRPFFRGIKWGAIQLIFPELVIVCAASQWLEARMICNELEKLYSRPGYPREPSSEMDKIDYTEKMGKDSRLPRDRGDHSTTSMIHRIYLYSCSIFDQWFPCASEKRFPLEYGFYAGMGGFQVDTPTGRMSITACGILSLANAGVFISVDRQTIANKSQIDIIPKALAVLQVAWMVIDCSVRKAAGLPLSLLEVHTLVQALYALIIYIMWFKKPSGVRDPTLADASTAQFFLEGAGVNSVLPTKCTRHTRKRCIDHFLLPRIPSIRGVAYDISVSGSVGFQILASLAVPVVVAAYAALHMTTWNFEFPTAAEAYVWRISCLMILAGSLMAPAWYVFVDKVVDDPRSGDELWSMGKQLFKDRARWAFRVSTDWSFAVKNCCWYTVRLVLCVYAFLSVVFVPVFLCARAAVFVESFVSLRGVPEGVYVAVMWTDYFPHM